MSGSDGSDGSKAVFRRRLLQARARLTTDERQAAERALLDRALELPELAGAATVAAYVSVGTEPGTRALIEALRSRGVRVLLPVLLADDDLDWARYEGPGSLARAVRPGGGALSLLEPAGPRLGADAVAKADAVLLPGLAVDRRGLRLGRGGGSYDRVLARLAGAGGAVPAGAGGAGGAGRAGPAGGPALVVLLYDHEVVDEVPAEPHDRVVDAVVTPSGTRRFPA